MRVEFTKRDGGAKNLVAEGEVFFDAEAGPLCGLKLVGFSVWAGDRELFVTFPSRAFGAGQDRRYFDYLRPVDPPSSPAGKSAISRLKTWILDEYEAKAERIQTAQRARQDPDHARHGERQ